MYLPQFHQIPENDEFWGKGFTDWVTVKKAKPLFEGHQQPKIPLNKNYYDLSLKENVAWQARLAKDYGIDGFGIYHYWFNNEKNILTKPAEIILENKEIDIDFFFAWDNNNWKRSWSNVEGNDWAPVLDNDKGSGPTILIPYILGEQEDWIIHYNAVRKYFLDSRYIKKDNKPLFIIFSYDERIAKMCACWDKLAQNDGFNGIFFIFRYEQRFSIPEEYYKFTYEPGFSGVNIPPKIHIKVINKLRRFLGMSQSLRKMSYEEVWDNIISNAKRLDRPEYFHGGFVSYDDTPRRGCSGTVIKGCTADKFKRYLSQLIKISEEQGKEFVFIIAWNEWGEGACLEPSESDGFSYLDICRQLKEENRE